LDATIEMSDTAAPAPAKGLSTIDKLLIVGAVIALGLLTYNNFTAAHAHGGGHGEAVLQAPNIFAVIPFVALLLCIAVLPLIPATEHWWESNKNRLAVALALGGVALVYYYYAFGLAEVVRVLDHAVMAEYIPFIVLLFALYVISGGISLKGDLAASPGTNTGFLAVGAVISSFVGTTGASMLLIRPLLLTNHQRHHVRHTVIFFIFLVSNIGGCLLPIGDPPLFLGYLRGVPFLWTFSLWAPWAATCGALLVIYYIWDCRAYKKETLRDLIIDEMERTPLRIEGKINLLLLGGIVFCVALVKPGEEFFGLGFKTFPFLRELLMLGLAWLSVKLTAQRIRTDNKFDYHAILEVAALFIGIFICMQVPIQILQASGKQLTPLLNSPHKFYWATGALSSFLDNAPTYVVFFQTAETMTNHATHQVVHLMDGGAVHELWLTAVSLGAVFMGSMSYIGNGPNFMVKSIAEQSGVKMPSFFGYMVYSCLILIPLFIAVTLIFL